MKHFQHVGLAPHKCIYLNKSQLQGVPKKPGTANVIGRIGYTSNLQLRGCSNMCHAHIADFVRIAIESIGLKLQSSEFPAKALIIYISASNKSTRMCTLLERLDLLGCQQGMLLRVYSSQGWQLYFHYKRVPAGNVVLLSSCNTKTSRSGNFLCQW